MIFRGQESLRESLLIFSLWYDFYSVIFKKNSIVRHYHYLSHENVNKLFNL